MSRFKHRKFDVTCDSNGTNCWIPVEQAKALLCDAMAVEAENERLRKAGDAMYDFAVQDSLGYWVMPPFQRWGKEHHSRNAAKEGDRK